MLGSGPQIAHVAQFRWQYAGLADAHSVSVEVTFSYRTCSVAPQTKHTVRGHLDDYPGSPWPAMGVVDGEAGLG